MEKKNELNLNQMEQVSGGTPEEYIMFMNHLMQKYNVSTAAEATSRMNASERAYATYILKHEKGTPLKPYPA